MACGWRGWETSLDELRHHILLIAIEHLIAATQCIPVGGVSGRPGPLATRLILLHGGPRSGGEGRSGVRIWWLSL